MDYYCRWFWETNHKVFISNYQHLYFSNRILNFHRSLSPDWVLPEGIELLFPFREKATWETMTAFYNQYFSDSNPRILVLGINPGRFGAGVTGVAFTDPVRMTEVCGIDHPFNRRAELSSVFVYDFIEAFGGVEEFYRYFYISSVCPLGFLKDGKNYNYYDDKQLEKAVTPHIVSNLRALLSMGGRPEVVLCLGQGKNYKYLSALNAQHGFFEKITPLPHPRWVMQYRRKKMTEFKTHFVETLTESLRLTKVKPKQPEL